MYDVVFTDFLMRHSSGNIKDRLKENSLISAYLSRAIVIITGAEVETK
jgi:hypothetical protein